YRDHRLEHRRTGSGRRRFSDDQVDQDESRKIRGSARSVRALVTDVATSPKTPRGFTVYCYGLGFVALATAAVLALTTPLPDPLPLILLGALFAIAENRVVMLPNNAMSASFMLGMAAVVVFASSGAILGPLVVGMCGALYLPHLRERQWTLVMF